MSRGMRTWTPWRPSTTWVTAKSAATLSPVSVQRMMRKLHRTYTVPAMFDALAALSDTDLERTVEIRKQPHSVMQAINRQLTHYAYHVGQIVFLSKHFAAAKWTTLTMPRKKPQV